MKHLTITLLTLLVSTGLITDNEIKDIPPIMLPSDLLKGNYIGLIQCKTLYEMHLFTAYGLREVDYKDNSKEFLESKEFKETCDILDSLTIRCGYIEKFKEKSNELAISQDLSREDFWSEKDLAEFYAYKMHEFLMMASEEETGSERIAKLQISDDLSACMTYRDYVDGNLKVDLDLENEEQMEELIKKDFSEQHLHNQAMMYLFGRGAKQDIKEAVRLFTILAEEGNEYSQANLGLLYADGTGVKQDQKKAVYWFRKSAEQGNAGAIMSLGFAYAKGRGVDKDLDEAIRLYRLSAEQGNWMAQRKLGYIYIDGEGVPIDLVYALMWFILAASAGDEVADSEVQDLINQLDKNQLREATGLVDGCFDNNFVGC